MQYDSGAIERIMREHGEGLEGVRGCEKAANSLASLERRWVPGMPVVVADEVRQLQERLTTTHRNLSSHMHFEEKEFLPTITRYAAEIVSGGLCFEHATILNSITELIENVPDLVGEPADREELLAAQAIIRGRLDNIGCLLEEHARKAEMIADLARKVIESQTK